MRDLHTLIKMQKLKVDEQRRALADKQREVDGILMAIATSEAAMETEKALAAEQHGGHQDRMVSLGAYIKNELARQATLRRNLSIAERRVDKEREKLAVLFEEQKRYEIAQENWDKEKREEEAARENFEYDEQASQRHHKEKGS